MWAQLRWKTHAAAGREDKTSFSYSLLIRAEGQEDKETRKGRAMRRTARRKEQQKWLEPAQTRERASARCAQGLKQGCEGEEEEGGDGCQHKCYRKGAAASKWAVEEDENR